MSAGSLRSDEVIGLLDFDDDPEHAEISRTIRDLPGLAVLTRCPRSRHFDRRWVCSTEGDILRERIAVYAAQAALAGRCDICEG